MVVRSVAGLVGLFLVCACSTTEPGQLDSGLESTDGAPVTSTSVNTNAESTENASVGEDEKLDPNRKVCKPVEVSGSRIARSRICRTAAEWEAIEDATENSIRRRLRNTSQRN